MADPSHVLVLAFQKASQSITLSLIDDQQFQEKIDRICRHPNNRAVVRFLLAACLAKIHNPTIDIRKPYTELGSKSYSGRSYDERYITPFINTHKLPCNPTTAFLTPAFRTKPVILTYGTSLGGRPKELYDSLIDLLEHIENDSLHAEDVLAETIRCLLILDRERQQRVTSLLSELKQSQREMVLSSEDIVTLIEQHLAFPRAARLPVLVVAAAYQAASLHLGEQILPLQHHQAADEQTGALGDVEITLLDDNRIVTCYEMKLKQVTRADLDRALQKIARSNTKIDNYIFITTDRIENEVSEYAKSLYRTTGGIEFAILDCIGFLRHFLHLFHRLRLEFLNTYQQLVLNEPDSAVRQSLKEVFLAQRRAIESSYHYDE